MKDNKRDESKQNVESVEKPGLDITHEQVNDTLEEGTIERTFGKED